MKKLTIGKLRGLQQIASPDGLFIICAMDHRGSLQRMIDPAHPESVTFEQIVEFKVELCSALAKHSTAVLLDPIYGAAQCISRGVLPGGIGLLVSIESTGYGGGKENRVTELLDDWDVGKIKRLGASAVKILVYYRPDLTELAQKQQKTVAAVAKQCIKYDLPFLVETVSYPIKGEIGDAKKLAEAKGQLVVKTAEDMTRLPIDVLKVEFPGDLRYQKDKAALELCQRIDQSSQVPWVLLSGGVDFDTFLRQVEIACRGGASGFLGGRAIWQEAMEIKDSAERVKFLSTVAVDRVKRLAEVTTKCGVPWYHKLGLAANELATVSEKWYQEY